MLCYVMLCYAMLGIAAEWASIGGFATGAAESYAPTASIDERIDRQRSNCTEESRTQRRTSAAGSACYAMLCYAMLCYAMLCYAMLGIAAEWASIRGFATGAAESYARNTQYPAIQRAIRLIMRDRLKLRTALLNTRCIAPPARNTQLSYAMLCYAMLCYAGNRCRMG